MLIEIALLK